MTELQNNLNKILEEKTEKLIPENLKKGVTCLGVEGVLVSNTNDADATEVDILEGKTAYVKDEKITGIMSNNGSLNYIPSEEEQSIPKGYASEIMVESIDIEKLESYKNFLNTAKKIFPGTELRPYIKYNDENTYTNLEITPNNKYKYEIHFDDSMAQKGNDITLFGSYGGSNGRGILFGINNSYQIADNRTWIVTSQSYKPGQHILIMGNNLGVQLDGNQIQTLDIYQNNVPIWLNKANFNWGKGFNGKIFEFIVYDESEEIIFDAVPNKSGTFYDKISEKLLSTSGEVEFGYDNWTGYVEPSYTELEYISNPNGAYIDTGIKNVDYCKTELKLQGDITSNQRIFGFHYDSYHMCWFNQRWYYGSEGNNYMDHEVTSINSTILDLCTIIYNDEDNKVSINGEKFGNKLDVVTNSNNRNITIFKEYSDPELYYGKLYYFRIINKQTDETVLDLIPAKSSYGYIGMYDKISHNFYSSKTDTNFIAGPEIGPINKEV